MEAVYWSVIFIAAMYVLIKSADYFIDSVQNMGEALEVPTFILGATIVAVGTSLPELFTCVFAVLENSTEIVTGNVVGSNISNILLIIGLSMVLRKSFKIDFKPIRYDFLFFLISSVILTVFIWDGIFSLIEGVICVVFMLIYVTYTISFHGVQTDPSKPKETRKLDIKQIAIFLASGALIMVSSNGTILSIEKLAHIFGTGEEIIALTILAFGTSLPELVVSIVAARKNAMEIVIGNILGSNIFNTFAVMGIPTLISELVVPEAILGFSLPIMILATILLFVLAFLGRTARLAGVFFLILYFYFIIGTFLGYDLLQEPFF